MSHRTKKTHAGTAPRRLQVTRSAGICFRSVGRALVARHLSCDDVAHKARRTLAHEIPALLPCVGLARRGGLVGHQFPVSVGHFLGDGGETENSKVNHNIDATRAQMCHEGSGQPEPLSGLPSLHVCVAHGVLPDLAARGVRPPERPPAHRHQSLQGAHGTNSLHASMGLTRTLLWENRGSMFEGLAVYSPSGARDIHIQVFKQWNSGCWARPWLMGSMCEREVSRIKPSEFYDLARRDGSNRDMARQVVLGGGWQAAALGRPKTRRLRRRTQRSAGPRVRLRIGGAAGL